MIHLIFLTLWFHNVFRLIFPKSSFWPKTMYAGRWRKLAWTTVLGSFPALLVQGLSGALMNSCLLEYDPVFPIKNKYWLVIMAFYFDLFPPFYFLNWNRFFSNFIQVFRESHHYFNYLLSLEICTNLQRISANETLIYNLNVRGFWIPK